MCTQHRKYMFGDVVDGTMVLNDDGQMVQTVWNEIPEYYRGIGIDEFVIMPDHVHRFKTMTTKLYTDGVKQHGWPAFPGKLWQRNYYEHIVRNEMALKRIRQYNINNPMKWGI